MTSRRSSGSSRAPSAVEPTRSQNMTVSWRRSGPCGACGSTGAGALPVPAATPQSPQNRLPMGFAPPHAAQRHGNGAPQSPQNRLPSGAVAPQRRQLHRVSLCPDPAPSSQARHGGCKQTRRHRRRNCQRCTPAASRTRFPVGGDRVMLHCSVAISAAGQSKGDVMNAMIRRFPVPTAWCSSCRTISLTSLPACWALMIRKRRN